MFGALERDWERLASSPGIKDKVTAWGSAEPSLAGLDAREVVERVAWEGYVPSAEGASVLSALLRLSACTYAARALLQALVPRMRAENVYTPTFGHRLGDRWRRPSDTAADFVAECFAAICRHAGEDRDDVCRLVVGEAVRRLRTARQVERRHQQRTVGLGVARASGQAGLGASLYSVRSEAELLAGAVLDAFRLGRLTPEQAAILYGTRVKGCPASEVGRRQGMAPRAVYHALAIAERALLSKAGAAA